MVKNVTQTFAAEGSDGASAFLLPDAHGEAVAELHAFQSLMVCCIRGMRVTEGGSITLRRCESNRADLTYGRSGQYLVGCSLICAML